MIVAAFVLPATAFAAMTSGLAEFLVVTLLLILAVLAQFLATSLFPSSHYWMELEWLKTYFLITELAGAAGVILIWQYVRRNTIAARVAAATAALALVATGALLPWSVAFALQTHLSRQRVDPSSIRVGLDSERKWLGHTYVNDDGQVVAELPIQITGLPFGTLCKPNGVTLAVRASDGTIGSINQPPQVSFDFQNDFTSLRAVMGAGFYATVKDQPIHISGKLFLTIYGDKQSTRIPLQGSPTFVAGFGLCSASTRFVSCNSAFRQQASSVVYRMLQDVPGRSKSMVESPFPIASYSPFPADLNVDPLFHFFSRRMSPISEARVEVMQPVAHLERDFTLDGVRLIEWAVHPSAQVIASQAYWPATNPEDHAH